MTSTSVVHSASAVFAAVEGEPNPLLPHMSELIVGSIAFLLLFLFLRSKIFPVFERIFAERRDSIEGGMERAKEAEAEAKETLEQYRAQLAEARHEAARLREDAREQGAAILADMREQAQAESRRLTNAAHQQIEADRQQAVNQLRVQIGALATDLASRIVGESLEDDARQRRVIERFLDDLDRSAGNGERTGPAATRQERPLTPGGTAVKEKPKTRQRARTTKRSNPNDKPPERPE